MSWLLCRWLFVRVGFVWRLLAGEAVRGEGREYGCMVAASCRYRCGVNVTGAAGVGGGECVLSLRWEAKVTLVSHHEVDVVTPPGLSETSLSRPVHVGNVSTRRQGSG
jgi:hypothetical protein